MYQDKTLLLSDGQTASSTAASTNVVDLGASRDIARGEPMFLYVAITARGATSPTTHTIVVKLQSDDDENFGSATDLLATGTLTNPAAGTLLVIAVPPTVAERYMRAYYTIGGTSPSFTVDAWLSNQAPQHWVATADAI